MTSSFGLDQIAQIHLSVEDIDRSVVFYRDVLGMRLLFQVPGTTTWDIVPEYTDDLTADPPQWAPLVRLNQEEWNGTNLITTLPPPTGSAAAYRFRLQAP